MTSLHEAARAGDAPALNRLIEQGAATEARDEDGRTPLMVAAHSAQAGADAVRLLLERGADANAVQEPTAQDEHLEGAWETADHSALAIAIRGGDVRKVEALLAAGADISYERDGGHNALIDALYSGLLDDAPRQMELIELLLAHGASPHGESDYGESALSVASRNGRFDVVARLLEAGADEQILGWDELARAVALGSLQDVERLLAAGTANLQSRDGWGRTPFLMSLHAGDLEKAQLLLQAGADVDERGHCGQTVLMHAIESEQTDLLSWLLARGASVEARNDFGHTALMEAAEAGHAECVRLLLRAGADPTLNDKTEESEAYHREIRREMRNDPAFADSAQQMEEIDEYFDSKLLPGQKAIEKATSLEVARLLMEAGEDLSEVNAEVRAELTGLEVGGEVVCSPEEYEQGRHHRFGQANPEKMEVAFWQAMVRSGASAYAARATFGDTEYGEGSEPVWCFQRFGRSVTELPDGRVIEVGGEHEDFYDSDFRIYNEVFMHHPRSPHEAARFDILGYPEEVFPPTDFHSATLAGEFLYIIGCLGYPEDRRPGHTPIYRLHCETFAIDKVEATGQAPGWIHKHKAAYRDAEGGEIVVRGGQVCRLEASEGEEEETRQVFPENDGVFVLNLARREWRREAKISWM